MLAAPLFGKRREIRHGLRGVALAHDRRAPQGKPHGVGAHRAIRRPVERAPQNEVAERRHRAAVLDRVAARRGEFSLDHECALALHEAKPRVRRGQRKRHRRSLRALHDERDREPDEERQRDEGIDDAERIPCGALGNERPPEMRAVARELVEDPVRRAADDAREEEEPRRVAPARHEEERRRGERAEHRRQHDRVREVAVQFERQRGVGDGREEDVGVGDEAADEARDRGAAPDAATEDGEGGRRTEQTV